MSHRFHGVLMLAALVALPVLTQGCDSVTDITDAACFSGFTEIKPACIPALVASAGDAVAKLGESVTVSASVVTSVGGS